MQKDVIYIDVEDDITAIIGKVKGAKEKIVALVPPKRIGVLQSAVNLRLLARAGDQNHKHVVLITNNQALMSLASSAKIPVAKNLQSKPELAEIPALVVDDEDDIIDGEQLPVGELEKTVAKKPDSVVPDGAISNLSIDGDEPKSRVPASVKSAASRIKSPVKVPSFNRFRKKVFIFAGLGIAFIIFLIWAIWFAPHATIVIDARTTERAIKSSVTLGTDVETNADQATIKAIAQQEKESVFVDFDATGTQEVGDKAVGTMTLTRSAPGAVTVPYGSGFSNGDCTFITQSQVTVSGAQPVWNGSGFSVQAGTADVKVQASKLGDDCNLSARGYDSTVEGIAANGGQMSGGTKREIKIVTQADVAKATDSLNQKNADDIKKKLKSKFATDAVVIDDSLTPSGGDPQSAPAIGQEAASGKAKLTRDTTYTMTAVSKNDLDEYLKAALEKTLTSKDEQRVYDNGLAKVQLSGFKAGERVATANISSVGQIGPRIDDNKIKEEVKGKRYGEIQADLKGIEGVNDADTRFSPFWVQTVPNDVNKIKIEFKLKNDN
jgi:hypothetical protein